MCKHRDKIGEIYYTNKLSKKISIIYENDDIIKLIKKEFKQDIEENENNKIIKPYDYQNKIIKLADEYYKTNNSSVLALPCGSGKTLISCYISMNYKIVIMITPLRQYAKQNIDRFKLYEKDRKSILIDSDGTRNIEEINNFIINNSKSKILLSVTFKSCDIINDIIDNLDNIIIIFDEFHNFSYNNIYNDQDYIYKLINNKNIKKLYVSATPRIYELENNDDIDVNEIFGEYIYKMSFNEAITNKYISDYELYLPVFSDEQNNEINDLNIHQDYLLKLQFLIEAIKMCGTIKMIIYMKTYEDIELFIKEFNKINEYYNYDVLINKIISNTNSKNRNNILEEFNNSNKISLLFSVNILDEAIDIPSCNSIYMTNVSLSKVKNIQRMSRAMRYQQNKIAKIFLYCTDTDEALDYISSIREYDTDFIKKINYINISDEIKTRKEREKINNEYKVKNNIKILGIKLYRNESWNDNFLKLKKYIDENNIRPAQKDKNAYIKKLGIFFDIQKINYRYKKHKMKDSNIYKIWTNFMNDDNYKKYFDDHRSQWLNKLNELKNYIDIYIIKNHL